MNFEKIFEMLNELQKSALICLIIQLPLCYTFMYIYSDFFAQQDFINRTIFALSLDMSILFISIFGLFKLRDPALFQTIWFTYSINNIRSL